MGERARAENPKLTDGRSCGEFHFCDLTCPPQPVDRTCSCWGLICPGSDLIFKNGFE